MNLPNRCLTSLFCPLVLYALVGLAGDRCAAESRCVVAAVNPIATEAGLQAFRSGGNAVDAAIATALTLGVVDNHNSGLGGGCFILICQPHGEILAIDGREKAPAAATRNMYIVDGKANPRLSTTGPLAVAVPGALAAYSHALQICGQKSLADLVLPAAEIAERGFPLDRVYANRLKGLAKVLAKFPGSRAALLKADGSAYREGEILKQPDLAATYRQIATGGTNWFYRGEFAQQVGEWMSANGGILTAEDFAAYEAVEREPLVTTYRGWKIIGFPPPSSGGVHVAQILNILEPYDVAAEMKRDEVRGNHLLIEAMKLAFADRAHWLGDADFVSVPRGLIDKQYGVRLARQIDLARVGEVPQHGEPPAFDDEVFGKHTTHIAAVDSDGYWVAITATVNTGFGSKVIVPGTGVVLNDEMDDFSSQPGVPNAFGLIGAENNAIEPGKRPLSSMSPTIVLDTEDKPVTTVGAAGGPKIITQVVLALIRTLDLEQDLASAIAAPRIHHQWRPNSVLIEEAMSRSIVDGLQRLGHEVEMISHSGVTQGIARNPDGELIGVHDPRVPGQATSAIR